MYSHAQGGTSPAEVLGGLEPGSFRAATPYKRPNKN